MTSASRTYHGQRGARRNLTRAEAFSKASLPAHIASFNLSVMVQPVLKAGELAARARVGVQTLHYYERIGLLPKANRSVSNYRLYQSDALRRVQFIKKAQSLRFALEEIKEILGLRGRGRAPCRRVADVGKKHLQELDARIAALQEFRRELAAVVPKWEKETSRQRKCAGEFCDLIERLPENRSARSLSKEPKKALDPLVR